MPPTATRYSIASVRVMAATLALWIEQSEDTLANAEDQGNEERIDSLNERIDALQTALDALEDME